MQQLSAGQQLSVRSRRSLSRPRTALLSLHQMHQKAAAQQRTSSLAMLHQVGGYAQPAALQHVC